MSERQSASSPPTAMKDGPPPSGALAAAAANAAARPCRRSGLSRCAWLRRRAARRRCLGESSGSRCRSSSKAKSKNGGNAGLAPSPWPAATASHIDTNRSAPLSPAGSCCRPSSAQFCSSLPHSSPPAARRSGIMSSEASMSSRARLNSAAAFGRSTCRANASATTVPGWRAAATRARPEAQRAASGAEGPVPRDRVAAEASWGRASRSTTSAASLWLRTRTPSSKTMRKSWQSAGAGRSAGGNSRARAAATTAAAASGRTSAARATPVAAAAKSGPLSSESRAAEASDRCSARATSASECPSPPAVPPSASCASADARADASSCGAPSAALRANGAAAAPAPRLCSAT
mmetsp:Transcript_76595/g.228240  ORF Transcript_76595/g.228240 Transcript_76595/m.228240 type:complete len:349 (+) Transcript_76595:74-1120(+)